MCYLKFKVPFFESFDKDLVSMIADKVVFKRYLEGESSKHHSVCDHVLPAL